MKVTKKNYKKLRMKKMFKAKIAEFNNQKRMIIMTNTGMNAADFKRTDPAEDPRIAKLERENKKLTQENKWLKESRPQETLEEIITEVLCHQWIDYIDREGNKRDPDGLCPAHLEKEFITLVTNLRLFFEDTRQAGGFSHHSSTRRELMVWRLVDAGMHKARVQIDICQDDRTGIATLEISPLQWELMVAITHYIEGHVIDADDIVYVAEKR